MKLLRSIYLPLIFFLVSQLAGQDSSENVHKQAVVIDLHADTILRHMRGQTIERKTYYGHLDLVRLKEGGVDAQFFALWPNPYKNNPDKMFDETKNLLDSMKAIIDRNEVRIKLATSATEIEQIVGDGILAACLGIEGGTAIEDDLDNLRFFYNEGVRYLGLTWNNSPTWASCAKDEVNPAWKGQPGLNEFGRQVISTMNELGMMVDLAHSGEQTFYDVLEITTKPVIVSHAAVHTICPHYRNLKDDQLKALAENGGMIGITFYPGYLVPGFDKTYQKARKKATAIQDSLEKIGSDEHFDRSAYIHSYIDPLYPDVGVVVDHIEYVIRLVGAEHVGLGSDYDGVSILPAGLEDVTRLSSITSELLRRGYDKETVYNILGGNLLRILEANQT